MLALKRDLPFVPVVETERLRLREHRPDDFASLLTMWSDERVYRYITGKASGRSDAEARLVRAIGHWAAYGFGYWVVEDKGSGAFVGTVGFGQFRREITPVIDDMPAIGWVLAPSAHGQGFATEAAGAAVAWGDAHFGKHATCCIFHPDHAASIRVAEKLGYRRWQDGEFNGEAALICVRPAPA
ncbi:GNAT family N-acetyltransferase [Pelagibacterium xiamenense]|uniref:GNAT family N-acetyltransferase n=1 Tax=Pelagibacterium xiamenense TaxID=2901140 RepID=UPI001E55C50A|nr:GNAT family N-acetyltransferase [Pelagibacterium xiamenense]MCD7061330.1 GNAT family N-acetyltransferase [Pelagibacterium xiamenense]